MERLNIGAGKTHIPGFINIDISDNADLKLDLSIDKLPFDTNSVDIVFSYHTLEHIPNYLFALSEIHRVLKHGGIFLVGVPYVTSTKYNLVNPYHLHHFNEYSFDFFGALKGSAIEENAIYFHKVFHRFYYFGLFKLLPFPFNKFCRDHFFNVVKHIDFGLIALKQNNDTPLTYKSKRELKKMYNEIRGQRIPYELKSKPKRSLISKINKYLIHWWRGEI